MKLPLVDYTFKLFQKTNFENVLLIAVQHVLESNLNMFEYLFKKGLRPENIFLLGKCYSTSKETLDNFRKKGVNVSEGSLKYNSHLAFDKQFELEVKGFLKFIQNKVNFKDYDKVLLVDDGGYLIYSVNLLIKETANIIGIEQTSSGYNKLKNIPLKFPVLNVARSKAKLEFESPFVASLVIKKFLFKIKEYNLNPKKVLIIWSGAIGKEIFNLLKNKWDIQIYDIQQNLSSFGKIQLEDIISEFDLIIGTTGSEVINEKDFDKLKKGAILISASSSDREFSAVNLRKLVPEIRDCHKDIYVKNIWLFNSGFPLNFDGNKNSISPQKIQLTRALMLSAICLAKEKKYENKFIELDINIQKLIIKRFNKTNYKLW
mgnify:CR=1 FL=1